MTVEQLMRSLNDFEPKSRLHLEDDVLVIGGTFMLTLPTKKKRARKDSHAQKENAPSSQLQAFHGAG